MGVALQEVELTKAQDDEYVHFGDTLQLVHVETSSVLACDVSEVDARPGEHACAATAAPQVTAPCARNALILTRYVPPPTSPAEPDYGDDTLRYGQKVQLAVHPYASGQEVDSEGGPRPLRLFSKPVSTTHFSKYCRNQLVGFTYRNSYDTGKVEITNDPCGAQHVTHCTLWQVTCMPIEQGHVCSNCNPAPPCGTQHAHVCFVTWHTAWCISAVCRAVCIQAILLCCCLCVPRAVWEVVTPDPEQRALSVGLEVLAGAPILLMHCATQKPLLVRHWHRHTHRHTHTHTHREREREREGETQALKQVPIRVVPMGKLSGLCMAHPCISVCVCVCVRFTG